MSTKRSITLRMDSELLDTVERLAAADNRTVNNMVETLMLYAVKQPDILRKTQSVRAIPTPHSPLAPA